MIKRFVRNTLWRLGYDVVKLPKDHDSMIDEVIEKGKSVVRKFSPDFTVLNGPFKGLQYPSLNITEWALAPKIAGTYESQLHPVVERIIQTNYADILDIGCAEGYYAAGFASRMSGTTIHCFDVNENDLNFCKAMAIHNNLNNLTYNHLCTPEILMNFDFKGRGLVFCDCEGCEVDLFTDEVVEKLKNVDFLIEMHDVIDPTISSAILTKFQLTHDLQVINNLNVDKTPAKGLESLPDEDKEFARIEHRGGFYDDIFMEWAFLTSKANSNYAS